MKFLKPQHQVIHVYVFLCHRGQDLFKEALQNTAVERRLKWRIFDTKGTQSKAARAFKNLPLAVFIWMMG